MRHTPRLLAVALLFAAATFAQSEPQPLRVTRIYNVGSTIIWNSSIVRQANFHTFCATGTGTWTVQMQYSDTSASGPWSNFGTGSAVGNDSESCAGSGIGYHPYLKFLITGSGVVVNYAGVKDLYIPSAVSSGTVYPSQISTAGGSVGDCPVIGAGGTADWAPCGSNGGGGTWGTITGNIADQLDLNTALGRKADSIHGHLIADVTALQSTLDGKAATSHAHTIANVTNLQTSLDAKESTANKGQINGYAPIGSDGLIPSQFVPAVGGVNWGAISGTLSSQTDLQTALDAKSGTGHNHSGTYEPANSNIQTHVLTTSGNPHGVTAAMIGAVSTGGSYTNPSWLVSIPWNKVTSSGHAASHQNGGSDEVATSVAAANAIPKAGSDGKLSSLWIPILNQNTTGSAASLSVQFTDWNASSGGASIANKPTLPANTTATANQFFTAYNSATGAFTKAAIADGDVPSTLTGKTVNSVTPTVFGYLDPTSSVQTQLNAKAPLASPNFTGIPAAPTAAPGTNTTQLATTAFVADGLAGKQPTSAKDQNGGYVGRDSSGNASIPGDMTAARFIGGSYFSASGAAIPLSTGTAASRPTCSTATAYLATDTHALTICSNDTGSYAWSAPLNPTGAMACFFNSTSGKFECYDAAGQSVIAAGTTLPTDSGNKVIATPADGSSGQSAARKLVNNDLPGEYICSATGGASNAYACAPTNAPTAYVAGELYVFVADVANTSAATVNFSTLGAKTIKKPTGGVMTDLAANDIRAGQIVALRYDGTNMQMISQLGNAISIGAGTVTPAMQTAAGNTDTYSFTLGADNLSADLVQGDIYPQGRIFMFPVACTIGEITVAGNAGTPSVMVSKNHAGTQTALLSGNLATASSGGVACAATGAACADGTSKSGSVSIVTTASANVVAAGDWIDVTAGAVSTGAKRISVAITCVRN